MTGLLCPIICSSSSGHTHNSTPQPYRPAGHRPSTGHGTETAPQADQPSVPSSQIHRGFAAEAATQPEESEESSDGIEIVRARIFGNHIGDGERSGRKVLRKRLKADKVMGWYAKQPMAKLDPLYVDPDAERCGCKCGTACCSTQHPFPPPTHQQQWRGLHRKMEKANKMRQRGKGPPKKGQGKRATKGKKKK